MIRALRALASGLMILAGTRSKLLRARRDSIPSFRVQPEPARCSHEPGGDLRCESSRGPTSSSASRPRCDGGANGQKLVSRPVSLYSPLFHHWCWQGGIAADVTREDFAVVASSLGRIPAPSAEGDVPRMDARDHAAQATLDHTCAREQPAVGGTDAQIRLQQVPGPADEVELSESPADISGLYHRAQRLVQHQVEDRTWKGFWQVPDGPRWDKEVIRKPDSFTPDKFLGAAKNLLLLAS